jgi:hypothetical protein
VRASGFFPPLLSYVLQGTILLKGMLRIPQTLGNRQHLRRLPPERRHRHRRMLNLYDKGGRMAGPSVVVIS